MEDRCLITRRFVEVYSHLSEKDQSSIGHPSSPVPGSPQPRAALRQGHMLYCPRQGDRKRIWQCGEWPVWPQ